jgi:hypothetical protein
LGIFYIFFHSFWKNIRPFQNFANLTFNRHGPWRLQDQQSCATVVACVAEPTAVGDRGWAQRLLTPGGGKQWACNRRGPRQLVSFKKIF